MQRLTLLFLLFCTAVQAQDKEDYSVPEIIEKQREKTRTPFISYATRDEAETYDPSKSSFYAPLTEWQFGVSRYPYVDDGIFYEPRFEIVPTPFLYKELRKNYSELSTLRPPALPEKNYKMTFWDRGVALKTVKNWTDRDVYLRVSGASSSLDMIVNGGARVYARQTIVRDVEDSSIESEANISETDHIFRQYGYVILDVYSWSKASWMENNSSEGFGVRGQTYLMSQPKIHIRDFEAVATTDSQHKNGKLKLSIEVVNNYNYGEKATVYYDLMDSKGNVVRYNYTEITIDGKGSSTVDFEAEVPGVAGWSAATPNIYHLMMRIKYNGRFTEYVPYKIGFRTVGFSEEGDMIVNGVKTAVKDTLIDNRGILPAEADIRAMLASLKKAGYNAIDCKNYPSKSRLYELCTEAGIYVFDRINIDTSLTGRSFSQGGSLGNNPSWLDAFIFRGENAYYARRNNTSLVRWYIGPEAGVGYNIYKLGVRMGELAGERFKSE